jgi:hypothetical protein
MVNSSYNPAELATSFYGHRCRNGDAPQRTAEAALSDGKSKLGFKLGPAPVGGRLALFASGTVRGTAQARNIAANHRKLTDGARQD